MSKKLKIPKPVKGYGYSGVWQFPSNTIGWNTTPYVSGVLGKRFPGNPADTKNYGKGKRYFLCEIKIKPLLDKKGRPITKIIK